MSLNLGKIFATISHDVAVAAKAVEKFVLAANKELPIVTNAIDTRLPQIESISKRLLGDALAAVASGGDAVAQHGLNLAVDVATVADLKTLAADFKDELAAFGIKL